jgi:hypothetical protein
MSDAVASSPHGLGESIRALIDAAHAEGRGVVIRIAGGKTFQPRGTIIIGPDHLLFTSEDQNGRVSETLVPFQSVLEVARDIR